MKPNWNNVKDKLPRSNKQVIGYYELWGDKRPNGNKMSRHTIICFYDKKTGKWYEEDNKQTLVLPSHWTEIPSNLPNSNKDQRINIGWVKGFIDFKKAIGK